jgi:N-acetylmuramoyl-L-alanine amidase
MNPHRNSTLSFMWVYRFLCVIIFSLSSFVFLNAKNMFSPETWTDVIDGKKVKKVVIDAGHGGKDPGCHGSFAYEKDICLSVALKLGKMIEEHFEDVEVIYTRKTDIFIELHNRAKIANDHDADLFICIHVNAGGSAAAYGAETYVMGLHKTEANLEVAKRENAAVLLEDDYQKEYEGFDPNSDEGNIIFSLYQNKYLEQSIFFASKVQHYFRNYAQRHDRGVRQAGFLVLVKTAMPSVLIETGFATHPEEEKFLAAKTGQDIMASSIFQAFIDYKQKMEGDLYAGMKKEFKPVSVFRDGQEKSTTQEILENVNTSTEPEIKEINNDLISDEIRFRVQFLSLPQKLKISDPSLQGIKDVDIIENSGVYRYTSGNEVALQSAKDIQQQLVLKGYKDAFVVAYRGNERISVKEALEILNKKN